MNKRLFIKVVPVLAGAIALLGLTTNLTALPRVGASAPDFSGKDANGKTHELAKYKGKYVVLEWLNHGCPYVKKHYNSKNMQALQKQWRKKGVVWLSVVSSAEGKQGYEEGKAAMATAKEKGANPSAILIDAGGSIGKAYGAKTTPHMFVINPKGKLIYSGAIDDKPTTDLEDVKGANNYVSAALEAAMAGKKIEVSNTKSYGCGVKYK